MNDLSHRYVWFFADPIDCSLSGSSVHRILQARILEWVASPFSRGSSWPRDWTQVSHIAGSFFFTTLATREARSCHCCLLNPFHTFFLLSRPRASALVEWVPSSRQGWYKNFPRVPASTASPPIHPAHHSLCSFRKANPITFPLCKVLQWLWPQRHQWNMM